MQVQTSEQTFFDFLILGKSRFPPKKVYNINYWSRVSPKHVQVGDEVHEPLCIDGHQVDDFTHGALLLRRAVHSKGFPVDRGDERGPEVHPDHKHLLEVLR